MQTGSPSFALGWKRRSDYPDEASDLTSHSIRGADQIRGRRMVRTFPLLLAGWRRLAKVILLHLAYLNQHF